MGAAEEKLQKGQISTSKWKMAVQLSHNKLIHNFIHLYNLFQGR